MLRRSFAAMLLVLALAGCGDSESTPEATSTQASPTAAVLVTTDCGAEVVTDTVEVAAGQTAMRALDQVADIETDSGGKFVTAIEGSFSNVVGFPMELVTRVLREFGVSPD